MPEFCSAVLSHPVSVNSGEDGIFLFKLMAEGLRIYSIGRKSLLQVRKYF